MEDDAMLSAGASILPDGTEAPDEDYVPMTSPVNGTVAGSDDGAARLHEGIDEAAAAAAAAAAAPPLARASAFTSSPSSSSAAAAAPKKGRSAAASTTSVEEQTALFEDILHPEMVESLAALKQLDEEEFELVQQLRKVVGACLRGGGGTPSRDFVEALLMELEMRRKEKQKTIDTFEQVETERSENTRMIVQEMRQLRRQNSELIAAMEQRNHRQEGNFAYGSEMDMYDWVVDIQLLGDLAHDGWKVVFSEQFYQHMLESGSLETTLMGLDEPVADCVNWQGAVIAVVGLYDKGKTFVLNQITQANLPSGKKCTTKGLSFKHVTVGNSHFSLLDSAGSYSPVKVVDELSVAQKEATELFLLDLIFDLSDYFICVVNDFTSLDQRYLDKLTRSLQNSSKAFREVIVVHNLKEVTSAQVLAHVWAMQVTQIYSGGQRMSTQVAAINPQTGKLEERHVEWFKTRYTRHICLAHHDSPVGRDVNPWTFSLLRYWLKSVFVPVDRQFSVVNAVLHHSNKKLSSYFKDAVNLTLQPGKEDRVKFIRPAQSGHMKSEFRLPQVALDASGLMLTRPDSFLPPVDVLEEDGYYTIYMDVPGLSAKDITLARQNVITIIKGSRSVPYSEGQAKKIEKQERKYGDFTATFTIPQKFERRWESCHVENGVLVIRFKGDLDDDERVLLNAALPGMAADAADFSPAAADGGAGGAGTGGGGGGGVS